jgi:protoporphyrinogen oxidase
VAKNNKQVLVLGAGPAGLAAAHFTQSRGHEVTLVERGPLVGGKGASREVGNFVLDFGPHAYHPREDEIDKLVLEAAGSDYFLTSVEMKLVVGGQLMNYPFRMGEALKKLSPWQSARILIDYLIARTLIHFRKGTADSFEAWGRRQFGETLYRMCFGDYTERVWGIPAAELSVELAKRKLPKMALGDVLRQVILRDPHKMHAHLFGKLFGYHRKGIGKVYEEIASQIRRGGGSILFETEVEAIRQGSDSRPQVELTGRHASVRDFDLVVSTIPLSRLANVCAPLDQTSTHQGKELKFRDILLVYVSIPKRQFSPAHWIYLVDERFSFSRISEQRNLSAECAPDNETLLTLEISLPPHSTMRGWAKERFHELVAKDLSFFGIGSAEFSVFEVKELKEAYPVYSRGYEQSLRSCLVQLSTFPWLITTGRQGLFRDVDMHEAMHLAKNAVDALLDGAPERFYRELKLL